MAPTFAEFLKLSKTQKNALTKGELMEVLESCQNDDAGNDIKTLITSITDLTHQIMGLTKSFSDHQEATRNQFEVFKQQLAKQNEIIAKQQIFLERQDQKERECNLVILGVPEEHETLEGATTDTEKLSKVWEAAGISCHVKSARRIGTLDNSKRRPILAEVNSKTDRDSALSKGKDLKTHSSEIYHKIYVKKDQHPSVRNEWKRLHTVFKTEKERPCNQGSSILFNFRERKVYKDGIIIDQWNMQNF